MKRLSFAVLALSCAFFASRSVQAQELSEEDPLGDIAADMAIVVRDLSKLSTGKPTQKTQKIVVEKLDALIVRLEKECAACRGGGASGANPTRPLADSVIIGGPGGIGDLHAPREGDKKWGKLPPHQRDRIRQSLTEGFPAHYRQLLERYYRRLAEEKPSGTPPKGPNAKNKPRSTPVPDKKTVPSKSGKKT